MTTTPTSLSLSGVVDNSAIIASTHRNNYAAVQTAVNALITFLSAGTSAQFVQSGGGTTINWAGAYTAYTPTWTATGTAVALGNGTITGNYLQIGKFVTGNLTLTMGTTTTYGTGTYIISLPVTSTAAANTPLGTATITDASASAVYSMTAAFGVSGIVLNSEAAPGVLAGQTTPITFAQGDIIQVNFSYQAS